MITLLTLVLRLVVTASILLVLALAISAVWWIMMTKGYAAFNGWTGGTQNSFVQIFNVVGTILFIVVTLFGVAFVILMAMLSLSMTWN